WYTDHPQKRDGEFVVSLSPEQLNILNGDARRLDIDLMQMGYLDPMLEDIRIIDIQADEVVLIDPPKNQSVNVTLQYRHSGISHLRRGGMLYVFKTGDYRVTADEAEATRYRDDHMFWGTVAQHR